MSFGARSGEKSSALFDALLKKRETLPSATRAHSTPSLKSVGTTDKASSSLGGSPPSDPFGFSEAAEYTRGDASPPPIPVDQNSDEEIGGSGESQSSTGSLSTKVVNFSFDSNSPTKHTSSTKVSPKRVAAPAPAEFAMPQPMKKPKPTALTVVGAGAAATSSRLSPIKPSMVKPVYRHKWNADDDEQEQKSSSSGSTAPTRRYTLTNSTDTKPGVRPPVRHRTGSIKDHLECHGDGENQSHQDNFDYLVDALASHHPAKLRSLSMLSLIKKCLSPEFRKFVRAHNDANKIFHSLLDAWKVPSLSLCTALLAYVFARDKSSLTVDAKTLHLFTQLMKQVVIANPQKCTIDAEYAKVHAQVWCLLQEWHAQVVSLAVNKTADDDGAKDEVHKLDITEDTLSTRYLIVESLVYISARRIEPWFLQTLLDNGTLEFIVAQVADMSRLLPDAPRTNVAVPVLANTHTSTMNMIERYLRTICHVSLHSEHVQTFLSSHCNGALLGACAKLLALCQRDIMTQHDRMADEQQTGTDYMHMQRLVECVNVLIRVCCNLSNNNELCCLRLGALDDYLRNCVSCITYVAPTAVPVHKRFDLMVLMIGLMCNLTEHSDENRHRLLTAKVPYIDYVQAATHATDKVAQVPTLVALTKMFVAHESAARRMDEEFDRELDLDRAPTPDDEMNAAAGDNSDDDDDDEAKSNTNWRAGLEEPNEEEMQAAIHKIMGKASTQMEDCVMASYLALLIGCLLRENEDALQTVCSIMPDGNVKPMVEQLKQFLEFMEMTTHTKNNTCLKAITKVIDLLTNLDTSS